jgi:hypothetical protein
MKRSILRFALLALPLVLVTGCKKKEETAVAEVAREAEAKLPATEQAPPLEETPAPLPGAPASPTDAPATAPVASAAPSGDEQAAYEAWFKKYNLDLNDPKMLDADPDDDGFVNRDEFLADTDPHDKTARPGIHKSIRLKEYNEVRLPLALESIEGGKALIKRTDQENAKSVTIKVGDSIKGLPHKVKHIETKQDYDKAGEKMDLSSVALEDPSTKETVILMKDLPTKTAASYAVLVSPDGKTNLKVRRGDTFTWPEEQGSTYRVLDLSQDQAVLQQIETKKTWTIPRQ